jgi:hypothetical protein
MLSTIRGLVILGVLAGSVAPASATCAISSMGHWCTTSPAVISVNRNGQVADVTNDAKRGLTKDFLNDHTIILPEGWNVVVRSNGLYQAQPGSGSTHDSVIQETDKKPAVRK